MSIKVVRMLGGGVTRAAAGAPGDWGQAGKKVEESLVVFYAIELLRAVEAVHAAG